MILICLLNRGSWKGLRKLRQQRLIQLFQFSVMFERLKIFSRGIPEANRQRSFSARQGRSNAKRYFIRASICQINCEKKFSKIKNLRTRQNNYIFKYSQCGKKLTLKVKVYSIHFDTCWVVYFLYKASQKNFILR